MELVSLKNWLNLTFVITTFYLVIFYTLTPPKNECQMTFMMEPPRFVPIPIDDNLEDSKRSSHPKSDNEIAANSADGYQLFMYNELGFPSSSNIHIDLKDSMPVLFVPGNAGSYQQVRSIASTSIRHQLQSLDAFKFIFYTIDFKGQLSGFSGDLIQAQTRFVHKAIRRISNIHPDYVGGTILIGHSVGGFISKLLLTEPHFDPDLISIIISLASPLTKPYLAFDNTMYQLYERANNFWSYGDTKRQALSISVTGGRSDRLVPSRLCMDPNFDIALSTGSIKDVWLTADHVCITWCRELMQKLSHLMSKLMDKRKTQIISDRNLALDIARRELLLGSNTESEVSHLSTWKTRRSYTLLRSDHNFHTITRNQLLESIVIVNVTSFQSLLLSIEHISTIKSASIFGCGEVEFDIDSSRVTCKKRVDLMSLSRQIPTKRFETRKTVMHLQRKEGSLISEFIVLCFNRDMSTQDRSKEAVPELVSLQRMDHVSNLKIWVPTLVELLGKKLLPSCLFEKEISSTFNIPLYFIKLELLGLEHPPLTVSFTTTCTENQTPVGPHIQLYRRNYLEESFQPNLIKDDASSTLVTLDSNELYMIKENLTNHSEDLRVLHLYIDGRCSTKFSIDITILDTVHDVIKNNLDDILVCLMYLACLSIINATYFRARREMEFLAESNFASLTSYTLVSFASPSSSPNSLIQIENKLFRSLILYTLTTGLLISLGFIMRRIIDIASILECLQSKIRGYMARGQDTSKNINQTNGTCKHPYLDRKKPLEWFLVGSGIAGCTFASTCLLTTVALFSIIKCGLSMELHLCKKIEQKHSQNKHIRETRNCQSDMRQRQLQVMNVNLAVLTGIVLLTNLPQAIVQLRSYGIYEIMSSRSLSETLIRIAAAVSTIMTKLTNDRILSGISEYPDVEVKSDEKTFGANLGTICNICQLNYMSSLKKISLNMLVLAPMMLLKTNICLTNYILLVTLVFVFGRLK